MIIRTFVGPVLKTVNVDEDTNDTSIHNKTDQANAVGSQAVTLKVEMDNEKWRLIKP